VGGLGAEDEVVGEVEEGFLGWQVLGRIDTKAILCVVLGEWLTFLVITS